MKIILKMFICCLYSIGKEYSDMHVDSLKNYFYSFKDNYKEQIKVFNKLTLFYGKFNFAKAKFLNDSIYIILKKDKHIKEFEFYFHNIVNYSMIIGNFQKVVKNTNDSQYYFKLVNDNFLLSVYNSCFVFNFQGRYKEVEKLALQIIRKFEGKPNSERIVEWYYYISTLNNDDNKPKIPFIYINKAAELDRSLFKLKEKNFEIQDGKFKLSKKETELQTQKQSTYSISIGLIVLLIIFLFLVYSYRAKQKKIRIITAKNEELIELNCLLNASINEKVLLLKEIHHRIKNNLQLVMSLLNIQALDAENITLNEFIENGRSRIITMSLIHESLYQTENFRSIDFQNYILKLVEGVSQIFKVEEVEFKINTNKLSFDLATAIPLALIINELVCNALKHAFTSCKNGKIEIEILQLCNQFFELRFSDNGEGMSLVNENSKSIGLEIVRLLVMQLNGKINRFNKKGTLYIIEFKESIN